MLLLLALLSLISVCFSNGAPPGSIPMRVVNHAGSPIELWWIDTFTDRNKEKLVMQTQKPLRNNTDAHINSYDTHQFAVKFLKDTGAEARFTKGPREEVVTVTYDPETGSMSVKQTTKFDELMDTLRMATASCDSLRGDKFNECVANNLIDEVAQLTDSKTRLQNFNGMISNRLRNYTCDDETMKTSPSVSTETFTINGKKYESDILLNLESAKIWLVHDLISPEECNILMEHGGPRLHRATVAAEDGTSVVSENRKAQQASYNIGHNSPDNSDPLYPLYSRVLDITNSFTGYDLRPDGQEDFTIIQYNVEDQYTPHCDGSCDATKHLPGGRVATAILYCKNADRGGGTTFTKSDIFVKPTAGMAAFFSYKDLETGRMDEGYTEHSGCPVLEGEKWITTVWMREGVSREDPWSAFDPNGVRMTVEEAVAPAEGEGAVDVNGVVVELDNEL